MSGPENTFIASVHRHLPVGLYHMKNHNQYNGGIADVWYSGGKDLWIEYKFIKVPVRDDTVIDLINPPAKKPGTKKQADADISALQQEWLTERDAEGRNVGVLVGSKDGGVWFPGTQWKRTLTAGEFRKKIVDRRGLAAIIVTACSKHRD